MVAEKQTLRPFSVLHPLAPAPHPFALLAERWETATLPHQLADNLRRCRERGVDLRLVLAAGLVSIIIQPRVIA
jgi:hypothetical protein